MDIQFVDDYIDEKIEEDEKYIICWYYELRVKKNKSDDFINEHLHIIKNKLQNMRYRILGVGEAYLYYGETRKVKENQLFVAIKEQI